eukprot:gene8049-5602_t
MTTRAALDAAIAKFGRKSPRDAYKQVCEELGIHYQRDIYKKLPEVPNAWHRIQTLELDGSLLGPKGCMSLLPIILVSTTLRKITLANCGLSDAFIIELCEMLITHPTVRVVDVSYNELISVFAVSSIVALMKTNSNMIEFNTTGTHVGDNVTSIIQKLGERNKSDVSLYYTDNYFKLKNIFGYLDENGEGWVQLKSLIMNCPYPVLQEQFVERIAKKKPKQRSDGTISVNTFMSLVYMNYKTDKEILEYGNRDVDEPYVFMVANWKQLLCALDRYNEEVEGKEDNIGVLKPAELPDDLHRFRIKEFLLTNDDADNVILEAVAVQQEQDKKDGNDGGSATLLSIGALLEAGRTAFRPVTGAPSRKKEIHYQFYEERDPAYVPEMMRNGSRLFDMNALAEQRQKQEARGEPAPDVDDDDGDTEFLPEDPPHTWKLPPSIVGMIAEYFHSVYDRLPKRRATATPGSPSALRDKAMVQPAIPIDAILSVTFETDFEIIKPNLLANDYSLHSMPIEDSTITLPEFANLLDERYVELSVDKVITKDQIISMENPFGVPEYAEMLAQYLDTEKGRKRIQNNYSTVEERSGSEEQCTYYIIYTSSLTASL